MATTQSISNSVKGDLRRLKRKMNIGIYSLETGVKRLNTFAATELRNEIETNYNAFISSLSHDHQDHTYSIQIAPRSDGGNDVEVNGFQVIYDEFGTGDAGQLYPHPEKNSYNLKDYNTGAHIKLSKNGGHYWRYFADGEYVTSQGVPSGQFVYKSVIHMIEGVWINDSIEQAFKDFYKAMKGK